MIKVIISTASIGGTRIEAIVPTTTTVAEVLENNNVDFGGKDISINYRTMDESVFAATIGEFSTGDMPVRLNLNARKANA